MKVYLSARGDDQLKAWRLHCGHHDFVVPAMQAIENIKARAIVAPGNSFGFMTGGIDLHYKNLFGPTIETNVQDSVSTSPYGELLVGEAVAIELPQSVKSRYSFEYLIYAPTMRVPENVSHTINAYLAAKAALIEAKTLNLDSIVFPGLGTGTGGLDVFDCAKQVNTAITDVLVTDHINKHRGSVYEEQDHMRDNIVSGKWMEVQMMEEEIL